MDNPRDDVARPLGIHTREIEEILNRVAHWAGGKKQAEAWYREQPLPAFGGLTAEKLVAGGSADAVGSYVDHVAEGGFA